MMELASIAAGLCVGVLSGMLGVGGGTLFVPLFRLGFGMEAIACTATSLFAIIPTSISGVFSHVKKGTCMPRLGLAAGLGGAFASPLGVWLAGKSPDWAIMLAAALVIAYSSITMLRKALVLAPGKKQKSRREGLANEDDACVEHGEARIEAGARELLLCAAIGLGAGLVSGYVGVGGGFIMVPLMMSLLGAPLRVVSGASLVAVMIIALPGVVYQGFLGNVDWLVGALVAVGTIPGAFVGARLASRVPERALRFVFSGFLLVAALMLVLDQLVY